MGIIEEELEAIEAAKDMIFVLKIRMTQANSDWEYYVQRSYQAFRM